MNLFAFCLTPFDVQGVPPDSIIGSIVKLIVSSFPNFYFPQRGKGGIVPGRVKGKDQAESKRNSQHSATLMIISGGKSTLFKTHP